ncbi:MAG: gamma-glutamyltransferase [Bacillota bacterium]|nr:gamma-glutamyltransferase [Bacillota bacterium]
MIVCPQQLAAEAGKEMLASGGNAADAAIAAAFVQGVVDPFLCGLGGMGIMYVHHGPSGQRAVIDGYSAIGSVAPPREWAENYVGRLETYGRHVIRGADNQGSYRSIMIPGFVRGLGQLYRRFSSGALPWSCLLQPAIRVAEEGFIVSDRLSAGWHSDESSPGRMSKAARFRTSPDAESIYGRPRLPGELFRQEDCGKTLRRLAENGAEDFYTGEIGRELAGDLVRGGALLTEADWQGYRVLNPPPLSAAYRGFEVVGPPVGASTALVMEMLQVAEGFDIASLDPLGPDYVDLICEIMRIGFTDQVPIKLDGPYLQALHLIHELTSKEHAESVQGCIRKGRRGFEIGTTHLNAADSDGTVIAFTHSIGDYAGSGVVSPGMGFLYNNFIGHYNPLPNQWDSIVPGKRGVGGSPTVLYRDGRPYLAAGAPGGSRIITAVVQTILNVVERGMNAQSAVSAPRCHSEETNVIFIEDAFPESTVTELTSKGYDVRRTNQVALAQAIVIGADGSFDGGSDPKGGGGKASYDGP